ncbi:hypothetical protein OGH69_02650 [Flavobacterium sp. MFBS3-15]|uniref:hypothetical protein n=1 Tax=Flavobacterium sp. MFBS3-15 TaxID=2989816 RepID=UPI0022359102|nr:hypothetical protein [Flavobacterium sp. MFBS3-15]MCW4467851.1 hypothetical protein [Flavobacterium sp. MFBS3-15]
MPNLTYTVTGEFSETEIELFANLPALTNDDYEFGHIHNISCKDEGGGQINALLIHMKLKSDDDSELSWNGSDPGIAIPVITPTTSMTNHPDASDFDWEDSDVLIILYHEPPTAADVSSMQKEAHTIYNTVKYAGPFSVTWAMKKLEKIWDKSTEKNELFEIASKFFNPRKAGMTIITKS